MTTHLLARFFYALRTGTLYDLVEQLRSEGLRQVEIYSLFATFQSHLRHGKREVEEDSLTGILDRLVGWCSPEMQLFPTYLTNEEIEEYERTQSSSAQ